MINPGSQPNSDSCKEKCSGVEIRTGLEKPSLGLARQVGGRWTTVLYQFSANNSESVCQGLRQITSLKPPSPLMACAWPMNWMSFSITFKDKREKASTPSPVIPSTSSAGASVSLKRPISVAFSLNPGERCLTIFTERPQSSQATKDHRSKWLQTCCPGLCGNEVIWVSCAVQPQSYHKQKPATVPQRILSIMLTQTTAASCLQSNNKVCPILFAHLFTHMSLLQPLQWPLHLHHHPSLHLIEQQEWRSCLEKNVYKEDFSCPFNTSSLNIITGASG